MIRYYYCRFCSRRRRRRRRRLRQEELDSMILDSKYEILSKPVPEVNHFQSNHYHPIHHNHHKDKDFVVHQRRFVELIVDLDIHMYSDANR